MNFMGLLTQQICKLWTKGLITDKKKVLETENLTATPYRIQYQDKSSEILSYYTYRMMWNAQQICDEENKNVLLPACHETTH
jgi:hypothetical protein